MPVVAVAGFHIQRLAVHFRNALGRPHHTGGVDRLVRRDQNHGPDPVPGGGIGHDAGAGHVGQQSLARVFLHHGHVLQRRGMEHQFGAETGEYTLHPACIAYISQNKVARNVRGLFRQVDIHLP